ncbi:unnamed protein product [Schistosoma curassoni]|nr:unnamed protein product [Schistosoma curassoni]
MSNSIEQGLKFVLSTEDQSFQLLSSYFGILDHCIIIPKRQLTTGEYVVRTGRYMFSSAGPVESRLNLPSFLRIYNESHRHNQKIGGETHFRVVIVSHHFNNLSPVQRERLVYKSVEHELQSGVHALSVILMNLWIYIRLHPARSLCYNVFAKCLIRMSICADSMKYCPSLRENQLVNVYVIVSF